MKPVKQSADAAICESHTSEIMTDKFTPTLKIAVVRVYRQSVRKDMKQPAARVCQALWWQIFDVGQKLVQLFASQIKFSRVK